MKTIYFTAGPVPTPQEITAAAAISGEVVLRNAEYVGPTDAIELCDAVAGDVPQIYIDYFKKPDGYFVDAPEDGQTYGRKDAAWDEVTSGGGGGGGLQPEDPAIYLNSILVARPESEGSCAWDMPVQIPAFGALNASAPYELTSTPLPFVSSGFSPKESGRTVYSFFLEVITPGIFILNRKVFVGTSDVPDPITEEMRYAYTLKVHAPGDDTPPKFVSFDRFSYSNAAITTFLAGVPDPAEFNDNVIDGETIKILDLNAGKYLIEVELSVFNSSAFFGSFAFEAAAMTGSGGIFDVGMCDFFSRNPELMPSA